MPDRALLHGLVDTLPEGALQAAYGVLEHYQVWPPQEPPRAAEMRQEHLDRMRRSMPPGMSGGGGGGGSYTVGPGRQIRSGSFSHSHQEGETDVIVTHRFHEGHELAIEERLRMSEDGRALLYTHEITGPGGEKDRRELVFDVGADSSA